jgi:hypothetical protein
MASLPALKPIQPGFEDANSPQGAAAITRKLLTPPPPPPKAPPPPWNSTRPVAPAPPRLGGASAAGGPEPGPQAAAAAAGQAPRPVPDGATLVGDRPQCPGLWRYDAANGAKRLYPSQAVLRWAPEFSRVGAQCLAAAAATQ